MATPKVSQVVAGPAALPTEDGTDEEVEGLQELFDEASIKGYLKLARALLHEWGAVEVTEVVSDPDLLKKMEDHLQLKMLERRRLQNAVRELLGSQAPGPPAAAAPVRPSLLLEAAVCAQAPMVQVVPGAPPGIEAPMEQLPEPVGLPLHQSENVVVKNTFLDVDGCGAADSLMRTSTAPAQFLPGKRQEPSGLDMSTMPTGPPEEGTHRAQGPQTLCLDRTTTRDTFSYEKTDPATWLMAQQMQPPFPYWPPLPPMPWLPPPNWQASDSGDPAFAPVGLGGSCQQPATSLTSCMQQPSPTPPISRTGSTAQEPKGGAYSQPPESHGSPAREVPVMQPIQCIVSEDGKTKRVYWSVPAKKLRSSDTSIVSPSFAVELQPEIRLSFKLLVYAKATSEGRDGTSFNTSRGRGSVKLKLLSAEPVDVSLPKVSFSLSVGPDGGLHYLRGPIIHDFSQQKVCGLPEEDEEWNFKAAVDTGNSHFMVNVHFFAAKAEEQEAVAC